MNKKISKFSGIKLQPLQGQHFDMLPAKKQPRKSRGLFGFFLSSTLVMLLFLGSSVYIKGKDFVYESKFTAEAGYSSLKGGLDYLRAGDYDKAAFLFEGATESFSNLQKNTEIMTAQANELLSSNLYLDAAEKLIAMGVSVSKIAEKLSIVLEETEGLVKAFALQDEAGDLTAKIEAQKAHLDEIYAEVIKIQNDITTLNASILPAELRGYIELGQEQIGALVLALNKLQTHFDGFLRMIGADLPHTYLVLLQNNHELRATGGFIGSYMLIDVNDGLITKLDTIDVYETDGRLTENIEAPPGIDKVADRLYMRDANYSPDFPTSAKSIAWFLEHSNGPSVDTIIAVDQRIAESLLELTGPIELEGYPFIFTAENFNWVMSYFIESKISDTKTPKQILVDLMPVFKERLLGVTDVQKVYDVVTNLMYERHIQVYSKDYKIQAIVEDLGIDGAMVAAEEDTDYLSLITTSIGGNKSDGFVNTDIAHHSEINEDGYVLDTVKIEKEHTWTKAQFDRWHKLVKRWGTGKVGIETLEYILGGGPNKDYLRVYVPRGSELISASGIDFEEVTITEDLGYTVFAFQNTAIKPGQSSSVELSYVLPFRLDAGSIDRYKLIVQKQAGAERISLSKTFDIASGLSVVQNYPASTEAFSLTPEYHLDLSQNEIFVTTLKSI